MSLQQRALSWETTVTPPTLHEELAHRSAKRSKARCPRRSTGNAAKIGDPLPPRSLLQKKLPSGCGAVKLILLGIGYQEV